MSDRVRILESKTVYAGKIIQLKVDRITEPGGVEATREIVHHIGSVVVLPRLPDDRVVMVRQFRYAAGRSLWELVAGGIEADETAREAGRRELLEEAGYRARTLVPLVSFYPSPGFLTEEMHLVEARNLTRTKAQPEDDERIDVDIFDRQQLLKMLRRKKIQDGKTLVGLLWFLYFDR